MKVTVIPIISGALEMVTRAMKGEWKRWKLEDELRPSKRQH